MNRNITAIIKAKLQLNPSNKNEKQIASGQVKSKFIPMVISVSLFNGESHFFYGKFSAINRKGVKGIDDVGSQAKAE